MGLLEEALAFHPWIHCYRMKVFYDSDRYKAAVEDFFQSPLSYRVIKFVRSPFKRAVSSYVHVLQNAERNSDLVETLVGAESSGRVDNRLQGGAERRAAPGSGGSAEFRIVLRRTTRGSGTTGPSSELATASPSGGEQGGNEQGGGRSAIVDPPLQLLMRTFARGSSSLSR